MSDLEDDINEPVDMVDESGEATADTEEETTDEAQAETNEVEEESQDESDTEEESESEEEPEAQAEEEPNDEAIKAHNAQMAQQRIAQREARLRQEAALLQAQQDYVKQAEDEDAKADSIRQIEYYNKIVELNERTILTDFERIKADPALQIFNPDSKEFQPDIFQELQDTFEKEGAQVDEWGNVVAVNASFYDKAKQWGNMWNRQAKISEAKASSNLKKSMSKAEPQSNSAQRPTKNKDPLMDILMSDD